MTKPSKMKSILICTSTMVSAEVVQTCMSIAYVGVLVGMAFYAFLYVKKCKLPTDQQFVFAWLVFDALIHILRTCVYSLTRS